MRNPALPDLHPITPDFVGKPELPVELWRQHRKAIERYVKEPETLLLPAANCIEYGCRPN